MDDLISREEAISTIKSMLYQTALNSVEGDEKAAQLYADIADNRVETWLKLVDSVDAVPVEWLKQKRDSQSDPWDYLANAIDYILAVYKKEQEAQDSDTKQSVH